MGRNILNFQPLLLPLILLLCAKCATKNSGSDTDAPRIFDKPGSNIGNLPRQSENERGELYVRRKSLSIVPLESVNTTGSLFNGADERNYLFAAKGSQGIGRFVDIEIGSNKATSKQPADGANEKAAKGEKKENIDDELMKSMPNLEPNSPDARPIHKFKLKIAYRYPNGDVLAVARRQSVAAQNHSDLSLQVRIPYERLSSGAPITTEDLTDITMNENSNGEEIERRSANWEDEYTLRMSGFNEANSKAAARIDQQREQLKKVRDGLKVRLVALGKEREQMAGERNKLLEKNTTSQTTIDGLNKSLLDRDAQIKTQQDTLAGKDKELEALKPKTEVVK